MENCLLTQLKGTVNNPSLQKLNSLRIHFHSGEFENANRALYVRIKAPVSYEASQNVKVYNTSELLYENSVGTLDVSGSYADYYILFPNAEGTFDFLDKYNFTFLARSTSATPIGVSDVFSLFSYDMDVSQFNYVDLMMTISINCLFGVLGTSFERHTGWNLGINPLIPNKNLEINLESFKSMTSNTLSLRYSSAFGDVNLMNDCAAMTSLLLDRTDCSGELTTLLNVLKTKGSTRDLIIGCAETKMTYNGNVLSSTKVKELNEDGNPDKLKFHIDTSNNSYTLVPIS